MPTIRLPVTGDWVDAALISAVTATNSEGGFGFVTVWTGERPAEVLTVIHVIGLERAEEVRDLIASMSGLADGADVSGFDPDDPDRGGGGGEDNEDEEEGGPGEDGEEGGDDETREAGSAGDFHLTRKQMRFLLRHWDIEGETKQ